ncbi:MAG TPA: class I SAM-dependent methyltransferase [Solirubrobacteraceae bacterium]|nr:class I SAM-dependent methyltransferase [Solirubrobacteraceae bacterium]
MSDSARISPTAHYTGYVWARAGLSHPELVTREGRVLFESVRPAMIASGLLGGARLEPYLLTRHRAIDVLLEQAIDSGGVSQVLEIACGLSPRGWRFAQRYGARITYVEADLPGMAKRKRAALERIGTLGPAHRVEVVDALSDESFAALVSTLEPARGLAIVTEGLTGYLTPEQLEGLWGRCAGTLGAFSAGRYLSDLHVGEEQPPQVRAFASCSRRSSAARSTCTTGPARRRTTRSGAPASPRPRCTRRGRSRRRPGDPGRSWCL